MTEKGWGEGLGRREGGRGVLVSESVSGGVVHTKYCTPSSKYTVTYYYELLTIVYAYENIQ